MKEKIAVIGSGISGLSASYLLSNTYDVHLFEKNDYYGGHSRTIKLEKDNHEYNIDTGFIVFNDKNYPYLSEFLKLLNIETCNSEMSFSVSIKNLKLEYGGSSINSIFAQKKNLFSLRFLKLILDIVKFYRECKKFNLKKNFKKITIQDFFKNSKYSKELQNLHIYPMISSIWSSSRKDAKNFPFESFVRFFNNHGLFDFSNRPQWKYINGGSIKYIKTLLDKKLFSHSKNKEVKKIIRNGNDIKIIFKNNEEFFCNKVVIATHADQALKILENPSKKEIDILSKFKYSNNLAYLHSDESFMPNLKKVWSSWNFKGETAEDKKFTLTYWMNSLQKIPKNNNFFVTINPHKVPKKIYDSTIFQHPIYSLESLISQKKFNQIQGQNNTWFCGSYSGYGFHEDGIQSSIYISRLLGVKITWKNSENFYNRIKCLD